MERSVGPVEIAIRLGVELRTVHMWKRRNLLPPPDHPSINGSAAWEWLTILRWAGDTGRLRGHFLRAKYTAAFGTDPAPARSGGPIPDTPGPGYRGPIPGASPSAIVPMNLGGNLPVPSDPRNASMSNADHSELSVLTLELRAMRAEMSSGFAEAKADLAEHRLYANDQFTQIAATLGAIIDELAALRAEFNRHTHEG